MIRNSGLREILCQSDMEVSKEKTYRRNKIDKSILPI